MEYQPTAINSSLHTFIGNVMLNVRIFYLFILIYYLLLFIYLFHTHLRDRCVYSIGQLVAYLFLFILLRVYSIKLNSINSIQYKDEVTINCYAIILIFFC